MGDFRKKTDSQPPRLAVRFFKWFCKESWAEPLLGDLEEQYQIHRKAHATWIANLKFYINVFTLLRPFAAKSHYFNTNHAAMLKTTFTIFLRQLKRNPAHSFLTIFSLCVGLCTVFISSLWISYHESFDEMHEDASQIFQVKRNAIASDGTIQTRGGALYEVLQEAKNTLPAIDHVTRIISTWRWPSEQCLKVDESVDCLYRKGIFSDSSFFKVFDFKITAGAGNPLTELRSIAFSASVAKRLFGDENPVGKKYLLDNHYEVTVTGIFEDIPATSSLQFDFVAPLNVAYALWGMSIDQMKKGSFDTYVKLNNAEPMTVADQIASVPISKNYPEDSYLLHPLLDQHLYTQFENGKKAGGLIDYLRIIGLFAFFVFLMSLVNFVNITTAQATARAKEIGVRKVSGAQKSALQLQFLFETFCKVLIAIALAALFTYLTIPLLERIIQEEIPVRIETDTLLKLLVVALVTPFLAGTYPSYLMSRFNPVEIIKHTSLKEKGKGSVRKWLTVLQVSVSCIIITMASAFYLQLNFLQTKSLGYDPQGVLMVEPTFSHIKAFESFKDQLRSHPQIEAIGISNANMVQATNTTDQFYWPGKSSDQETEFKIIGGDQGLLEVFQLNLIEGNGFNPRDTIRQMVLSSGAVSAMDLEDPVGKTVEMGSEKYKVAGVVADINSESLHWDMMPTIYYEVEPRYSGTFYVRYDPLQPIASIEAVEKVYDEFEPFITMKYKILNEEYQRAYGHEQMISNLTSMVMAVAVFIAIGGILGLLTFNISKRYRELGLRKIFGASDFQAFKVISKEFTLILFLANLIGGVVSFWMMQEWLEGFAYRIDLPVYLIPLNLLGGVIVTFALLAFKIRKVLIQNPVEVIRTE
ncbi:MAG: ABC transporter permease [Bacteroidota bacterium]